MARNASGIFTLVAGNPVVTGTVISSTWANDTMADIAATLTDSLSKSGLGAMTAPLKASNGIVTLPAITFNSETASGLYRAGANDIRMSVNGVDYMRWNGGETSIWDGAAWQAVTPDDWAVEQTFSGGARVIEDELLTMGTGGTDYSTIAYLSADDSLEVDMVGAGDEVTIKNDGTVAFTFTTSTGAFVATGDITGTSDARLKTDLQYMSEPLKKCKFLMGWNYKRTDLNITQNGLLAQDVQTVLPDSVTEDKDGTLGVAYNGVIALLVNCVNELADKVEQLENK